MCIDLKYKFNNLMGMQYIYYRLKNNQPNMSCTVLLIDIEHIQLNSSYNYYDRSKNILLSIPSRNQWLLRILCMVKHTKHITYHQYNIHLCMHCTFLLCNLYNLVRMVSNQAHLDKWTICRISNYFNHITSNLGDKVDNI